MSFGPPIEALSDGATVHLTAVIGAASTELSAQLQPECWYEVVCTVDAYVRGASVTGQAASATSSFVPANTRVWHKTGSAQSGTAHPGTFLSFIRVGGADGVIHVTRKHPVP
jgi:hypothetical protein